MIRLSDKSAATAAIPPCTVPASVAAEFDLPHEGTGASDCTISLDDWRLLLSALFFPEARAPASGTREFHPTFRELALYLMRLGKPAFVDPQIAFLGQPGASKRLCLSFLLGLNWGLQRSIHTKIADRSQLREAIKVIRSVEATGNQRTIGKLEAERVALEKQLKAKKSEVESFNVREDYRELEDRLNRIDRELHGHINDNHSDSRLRDYYMQSATAVPDADAVRPLSILRDAGAHFQDGALREIDEVAAFHAEVFRNRREFLQSEIARLTTIIDARTTTVDELAREKQQVLGMLRTSSALETLIALQRSYTDLNARYEVLSSQIEQRKRFDQRTDEIAATVARDKMLLKQDLEDRREAVDEVRGLFAEYTQRLYGRPGRLAIDIGKDGYSFTFTIDRKGSDGIDQMVVFCFDLTVASIWAKYRHGFSTLIHDSTLYADVDPRQYAAALRLAAEASERYGFQYICCLNVGSLPTSHLGDFALNSFVKLRLTDEGPEGRLLGKQLPPREHEAA